MNKLILDIYIGCRKIEAVEMDYLRPVSYTHLDVYKRQVFTHKKLCSESLVK